MSPNKLPTNKSFINYSLSLPHLIYPPTIIFIIQHYFQSEFAHFVILVASFQAYPNSFKGKHNGQSIIIFIITFREMKGICRSGDYRKYYEVVLSTASTSETKHQAVMSILKLAMTDDSHFSFLLNQIDWFCTSNKELIPLLNKIIRLYRGTSREACKVIYNLLADGLTISDINIPVVDVIAHSLTNVQDRSACFSCLRDNYPHKVCPLDTHLTYQNSLLELCKRVPSQRI